MQNLRFPSNPASRLPQFPRSVARVFRHIGDREISPEFLARLLESELELTERLMRAAVHPAFGLRRGLRSLSEAIACLGRETFHDLLFTFAAMPLFGEGIGAIDATSLRAHSISCGLIARALAERLAVAQPGIAYRAGVVHDIGLMALRAGPREASARALASAAQGKRALVPMEQSILGVDHAAWGLWYGEMLDLPRPILDAIRFHHDPMSAPPPRALAAVVGLGDRICSEAGFGYGFPEEDLSESGLDRYPAWTALCEEKPALKVCDPALVIEEVVRQVRPVRTALLDAIQDPALANA